MQKSNSFGVSHCVNLGFSFVHSKTQFITAILHFNRGLLRWIGGKEYLPMQKVWVQSLDQEDPLEEDMAIHSSILAWETLWTEEPGRLYSPWGTHTSDRRD